MASQRHMEYRACCLVDSIRLNIFKFTTLPMQKIGQAFVTRILKIVQSTTHLGSKVEFTTLQFSSFLSTSYHILFTWFIL
jgi:hypothetical protein